MHVNIPSALAGADVSRFELNIIWSCRRRGTCAPFCCSLSVGAAAPTPTAQLEPCRSQCSLAVCQMFRGDNLFCLLFNPPYIGITLPEGGHSDWEASGLSFYVGAILKQCYPPSVVGQRLVNADNNLYLSIQSWFQFAAKTHFDWFCNAVCMTLLTCWIGLSGRKVHIGYCNTTAHPIPFSELHSC